MDQNSFWTVVMQLAIVIAGLFAGGIFTVPVVSAIKRRLGTRGGWTMVVLGAFSTLVTLAVAIVENTISPVTVTPETWGVMLLAIIIQAHIRYRQLLEDSIE